MSEALEKSLLDLFWIRHPSYGQWKLIASFFCMRRESVEKSRNCLEFVVVVSLAWAFLCSVVQFRTLATIIIVFGLDLHILFR